MGLNKIIKTLLLTVGLTVVGMGAARAQPEIILKLAHNADTSEPGHVSSLELAEAVKTATNGRVEIQVFPNGQLGNERELIEGLLIGNVDIIKPQSGVLSNFVPESSILNLPYLFHDAEHMETVLSGPFVERLSVIYSEKGFRLLGFHTTGVRHIMSKTPITSISDLSGLKIRTIENPVHVSAFEAFGASATPIAYSEMYGALQTGVVDGADAANTNYYAKKFYEVAPYWAMVGWLTSLNPVIMSEQKFLSLPEEVQAILLQEGAKNGRDNRLLYAKSDAKVLEQLVDEGVKVTEPDVAPFREAAVGTYDEFLKTDRERELLDLVQESQ